MSTNDDDNNDAIDKAKLEQLVSQLDINIDNIFHIIFTNGMELVGEYFPADQIIDFENGGYPEKDSNTLFDEIELLSEEDDDIQAFIDNRGFNDLLFLNPIKIYRETGIDDSGEMKHINYFLEWNPCIEGPFTHINKNTIVSKNKPNPETLVMYLRTICKLYYPLLDNDSDINGDDNNNTSLVPSTTKPIINTTNKLGINKKNIIDFKSYYYKRERGQF